MSSPRFGLPLKMFGAVICVLIGCLASMYGSWEWQRTMDPRALRAERHIEALVVMVAGIVFFGLGCLLAALDRKLEGRAYQDLIVLIIMTPLPSLLAIGSNQLGCYVRVPANSTAKTIVAGLGVFLLMLGGMSLWQDYPPGNPTGPRDLLWTAFLDLGLGLLLVGASPPYQQVTPPVIGESLDDKAGRQEGYGELEEA